MTTRLGADLPESQLEGIIMFAENALSQCKYAVRRLRIQRSQRRARGPLRWRLEQGDQVYLMYANCKKADRSRKLA